MNKLTYTLVDDYYIPDLVLPKKDPLESMKECIVII